MLCCWLNTSDALFSSDKVTLSLIFLSFSLLNLDTFNPKFIILLKIYLLTLYK
ncbi:hypothetical protein HanIR_Chr14g0703271 [Helianthus annuus]|nr:hypothetical protein HanIR_Chr14g0703271 [Helianthus annuus]